jgi:hypothetical protein
MRAQSPVSVWFHKFNQNITDLTFFVAKDPKVSGSGDKSFLHDLSEG